MSDKKQPTLLELAGSRARGEPFCLPESAPLGDIAALLSSDAFLRVDSDKCRQAWDRLHTQLFKPLHIVVGQRKQPPILISPFFKIYPMRIGSRVRDLEREVREKREEEARRKAAEAAPLEDVHGMKLVDVLKFREQFIIDNLWPAHAETLLNGVTGSTSSKSAPDIPVSSALSAGVTRNDADRGRDSQLVDSVLACDPQLQEPELKRSVLVGLLTRHMPTLGWNSAEVERYCESLDEKPGIRGARRGYYKVRETVELLVCTLGTAKSPTLRPVAVVITR